jgi:hypothetical protein
VISELALAKRVPYAHQIVGVQALIDNPFFLLADEMGAGKTKQAIDAAQILFLRRRIRRVLVAAPSSVRPVWFDDEIGELAKHLFVPSIIVEWHSRRLQWEFGDAKRTDRMEWIITNYEFIRNEQRLEEFLKLTGRGAELILDESSAVKTYNTEQTRACLAVRRLCDRVVLLNGTPIANNPGDLFAQSMIMKPTAKGYGSEILDAENWFHFRALYAKMGGFKHKQIVGWRNLEKLNSKLAPFVLRRLKEDCLDLPPKLEPVSITVALSKETWRIYRDLRDELVAWLDEQTVAVAAQAGVKAMRLAQITSGFLGGLEDPDGLPLGVAREIGSEKLDGFTAWMKERLDVETDMKLLVWCRFRAELERLERSLLPVFGRERVGKVWGKADDTTASEHRAERDAALRLLKPGFAPAGRAVVVGTPSSGSMGLDMSAAHVVVYMSNDYSLKVRLQSEDRVHRPGQTFPVSYFDVIATGPEGQKTIDHGVSRSLRNKEDLANLTTAGWRKILTEE